MLAKLGWNEGQSLGKNSDGLLEPVSLHLNIFEEWFELQELRFSFRLHCTRIKVQWDLVATASQH